MHGKTFRTEMNFCVGSRPRPGASSPSRSRIERLCGRLLDPEDGAEAGELLRAVWGLANRLEDWRLKLWLQLGLLTDRPVRKRERLDP
jgi:hypothetical protein